MPDASFEAARRFLLRSWDPRLGAFRYSHDPSHLRSGYPTLPGSTPAALFALGLLGEDVGSEPFAPARRYTLARAPSGRVASLLRETGRAEEAEAPAGR